MLTRDEIMALEGERLAVAVAEHVMGWHRREGFPDRWDVPGSGPFWRYTSEIPLYHTDCNALSLVETEMGRRGPSNYGEQILRLTCGDEWHYADGNWLAWKVRTAPPELCCKAALLAVMEADHA